MKKVTDLLFNKVGAGLLPSHGCFLQHAHPPCTPWPQIFSDPQLRPFFEGISEQVLRHKQETMMEILFGGAVSSDASVI